MPGGRQGNFPGSVVMPDSSIMLMGGDDGETLKNDVWRFMPASSSIRTRHISIPSLGFTMLHFRHTIAAGTIALGRQGISL